MLTKLLGRSHTGVLLVLVLAPLAAVAVVVALLAGIADGEPLWWTFGLVTAGTLAFLGFAARGRYAAVGIVLLAAAAVVCGREVWTTPYTGIDALLGAGAPSVLTTATWLLVLVVAVLATATALLPRATTGVSARTWCALVATAVCAAGALGTGAWLGGRGLTTLRADTIQAGAVDHTVDASADPEWPMEIKLTAGPEKLRTLWRQPVANRTVVGMHAVPLVVSADGEGVAVLDARTGAERWHFRSEFFGLGDAVAVSPSAGRMLVVMDTTTVLLDLDSGTEVDRFALPEPTAGPTLGLTHYRLIGPQPRDPTRLDERPQVEITGNVVHIAVSGHPGPSDVLTVDLRSGNVSALATGVPETCRFRMAPHIDYVDDSSIGWLLRDGVGCGTPILTRMFDGRVQTEIPISQGCAPEGCELPDAYATPAQVVLQTRTELLELDLVGKARSRVPLPADRRSVVRSDNESAPLVPTLLPRGVVPRVNALLPWDGAGYFQYRATGGGSGVLVRADSTTGRETARGETVGCAKPDGMSLADNVLIVSCGSEVMAFG